MIYVGSEEPNREGLSRYRPAICRGEKGSRGNGRGKEGGREGGRMETAKDDKSCVRPSSRCFCQNSTHAISRFCEAKQGPSATMYGLKVALGGTLFIVERMSVTTSLSIRFDDDDMLLVAFNA